MIQCLRYYMDSEHDQPLWYILQSCTVDEHNQADMVEYPQNAFTSTPAWDILFGHFRIYQSTTEDECLLLVPCSPLAMVYVQQRQYDDPSLADRLHTTFEEYGLDYDDGMRDVVINVCFAEGATSWTDPCPAIVWLSLDS